jgi:hypothetical protein
MLRLMLDAHPELAIPGETHFLMTLWARRSRYRTDGRLDAEALVRDAMQSHQFRYWNIAEESVLRRVRALDGRPTFAAAIEALYMGYADEHGKRRWGDKTPQYVRSIPQLSEIFEGSRFVHMIRDGRDVALSYLSLPWGPPTLLRAARVWSGDVGAGRSAGAELGPARYHEVRYEELVDAPEPTVRRICSFLALRFDPAMLDYHRAAGERLGARPDRSRDHASTALPPTPGMRDWRSQMPANQVRSFEAVAGPTLSELGYERRFPRVAPATRLVAFARSRAARPRLPGGRRIRVQPKRRPGDDPPRADAAR